MTPQELFELALSYYNGTDNIPQDYLKAYDLFLDAAEHGHVGAQSYLGRMLSMGEGVEKNYDEAVKWLKLAAEAGDADAQNRLGVRYNNGEGVPVDYKQAFEWMYKAASQGHPKSYGNLGTAYLFGRGVSRNYSEALKYYKLSVSVGIVSSSLYHTLGQFYFYGWGCDKDYHTALDCFRKAADLGGSKGYLAVAHMYEHGQGINQDFEKAYENYLMAAEMGDYTAMERLARLYCNGRGCELNYLQGLHWLRKIGPDKYNHFHHLALMFNGRTGVDINYAETIRMLNRCSSIPTSALDLAEMYLYGIGIEPNPKHAVKIWEKLSRQGYHIPNVNIGIAYYNGYGVQKNRKLAIKYLRSVEQESEYAVEILNKIKENDPSYTPTFVTDYREINDSILEAETHVMTLQTRKAMDIYKKNNTGESYFQLAKLAIGVESGYDHDEIKHFFQLAIDKQYNRAIYLDRVFKDRSEVKQINFNFPFYLVDILSYLFGEQPENPEELCYIVYCVLNNIDLQSEDADSLPEIIKSTRPQTITHKHTRLYELCSYRNRTELETEIKEYLFTIYEGERFNSTLFPSDYQVRQISDFINTNNHKSLYLHNGGPLKLALNTDIESYIQCKTKIEYTIASYIVALYNKQNIKLTYRDNIHIEADVFVGFPELRSIPGISFDVESNTTVILKALLSTHTNKYKKAIILVDKEFSSSLYTEMYDLRRELLERKYVVKVKEFPAGSFTDVSSEVFLLFLDFSNDEANDYIEFDRDNRIEKVAYTEIQNRNYVLNSLLYCGDVENRENKKLIKLNELVSSCNFGDTKLSHLVVNKSHYSKNLLQAISTKTIIVEDARKRSAVHPRYAGKSIVLLYSDKLYVYVHKSDEQFIVEDNNAVVLNVKTDIVDIDYLAYLFLSDCRLNEYIDQIASADGFIMPQDILQFEILIDEDIPIQKQIVEQALIKERQMSTSGVEYNVILISEQSESFEKHLNEKGINIFQRLSSVNDGESSFEDLYEQYIEDPSKAMVDAIIIDSNIEDYEDVLFYFRTIRERSIQIYLLGDKDEIRIAGSKLKEYFLKENRIFDQTSEGYLDKLLNKMRDDLDSSNAPQAKIRNKYKAVFEAADALDKKYPDIGISKTVLRYIQTGCNIDDVDNVSGPCGSFRNVCHKLLQVLVSKKLVPDIDPGAIPAMLRDGRFYDGKTQRTYILKEQFMSKYLSRALEYFCKVTNEGVHGSQDSSRLGTAALNILMEFIVWFYENDICSNKLDDIPVNPCYEDITDKLPTLKGKVCTVKAQGAGKDRYLYADNIHIKENKSLKPGMKIKIKDVGAEMIAEDDRRKINDEYMVFYTSNYEIL